jgi:hypothetical protein
MLGAGHSHRPRVEALLQEARRTMGDIHCPFADSLVGLELVIRRPPRARLNDATNLLGGVADVLQSDRRGVIDLSHLGDLAAVAIYRDDAQIREVIYREESAAESSYRVRVWRLETASAAE